MGRIPTGEEIRCEGAIPTLDQVLQNYSEVTRPVSYNGPLILGDASGITDWTPWQVEGCVRNMAGVVEMYHGGVWVPFGGALTPAGAWDANANLPPLASGVGVRGVYYVVGTDGATNLDGITDWKTGDWALFNGTVWQKIDNTDKVVSVFGRISAVVAAASDYNASQVDNDSTVVGTFVDDALDTLKGGMDSAVGHISANGTSHANVGLADSHRTGNGSDHADVASNTSHRGSAGLDHSYIKQNMVNVSMTAADATGGATDALITADLIDLAGVPLTKTGVIKIVVSDVGKQYHGIHGLSSNVTFGAATKGTVLATGTGFVVVKADANGQIALPAVNAVDEGPVYFSAASVDGGIDNVANGVIVHGCQPASASWSA